MFVNQRYFVTQPGNCLCDQQPESYIAKMCSDLNMFEAITSLQHITISPHRLL